MEPSFSQIWRSQGDAQAFDHGAWEFRSRQFISSAKLLLRAHEAGKENPDFDSIMSLVTATFLVALAIELIAKANYLKLGKGPREDIYQHSVTQLCGENFFTEDQISLMKYAETFVVWAGRYPTPKWINEKQKKQYDVPSVFVDGIEHIDGQKLPNSASPARAEQLIDVYEFVHNAWAKV